MIHGIGQKKKHYICAVFQIWIVFSFQAHENDSKETTWKRNVTLLNLKFTLLTAGVGDIYFNTDFKYVFFIHSKTDNNDAVAHLHPGILMCRAIKSLLMHI